jgi:NTP pyrophosphatase (non-canonical NTP hydrolase)
MDEIFKEIAKERDRQNKKFGEQNHHPFKWLAILGEEVGEVNKAVLEANFLNHDPNDPNGLCPKKLTEYRKELIEVAAVAVSMIQSLDRNEFGKIKDPVDLLNLILMMPVQNQSERYGPINTCIGELILIQIGLSSEHRISSETAAWHLRYFKIELLIAENIFFPFADPIIKDYLQTLYFFNPYGDLLLKLPDAFDSWNQGIAAVGISLDLIKSSLPLKIFDRRKRLLHAGFKENEECDVYTLNDQSLNWIDLCGLSDPEFNQKMNSALGIKAG